MSSVSSVSSSSSIYGTRNVLSGLASGLDTESMIENAVSGYQTKITSLQQQRTKVEWEQDALRSMISKMVSFSNKYASYTSTTNLLSSSFFNNAVKVSTSGTYADKVSAIGRTSSDVQMLGVKQLATSASYAVSGSNLTNGAANPTVSGGSLDLSEHYYESAVGGKLTIGLGNSQSVDLTFSTDEVYTDGEAFVAAINEKLADQNVTLGSSSYKASDRIQATWDAVNNTVVFDGVDATSAGHDKAGNKIGILSATGNLATTFGVTTSDIDDASNTMQLQINEDTGDLYAFQKDMGTYASALQEKEISFTLDGVTKKINLADSGLDENSSVADVQKALQTKLDKAFGSGKITVATNDKNGLNFETSKGSTLKIDSGKMLGLDSDSETSYVNTSKKLGDLLGSNFDWEGTATMIHVDAADVKKVAATSSTEEYYTDASGNRVAQFKEGDDTTWYRIDEDGNWLHKLEINGETVGEFSKDTTLERVMTTINNNADTNLTLNYSKTTNQFKFTSNDSGSASMVDIKNDGGLAASLFGATVDANGDRLAGLQGYTEGQDAIFTVSVNGEEMEMKRSSNSVEIDGLTMNLKGTFGYANKVQAEGTATGVYKAAALTSDPPVSGKNFNWNGKTYSFDYQYVNDAGQYVDENGVTYEELLQEMSDTGLKITGVLTEGSAVYLDAEGNEVTPQNTSGLLKGTEAVTFKSEADSDTIVDSIKSMIEDYNAMVTEIKNAYSTLPLQKSNGSYYEPLTEDDMADMSDSAIERYEENAKTGLLFGDSDLRSLYTRLTNAVQSVGTELESIGVSVSYSDGLTTLSLNENKLRSTLETAPDKVRDAFSRSKENGAATNGLMQALKSPLDTYAKTTGATKGVLIERAGSTLAPTSVYQNTIQNQLDELDKQIEKWQDKLSDKVDYYTSKFTRLEQLISEMNSQSSTLSSLMGG